MPSRCTALLKELAGPTVQTGQHPGRVFNKGDSGLLVAVWLIPREVVWPATHHADRDYVIA